MIMNRQTIQMATVLAFARLIFGIVEPGSANAGEFHAVSGVVEHASQNYLTINNKLCNITGAPVVNVNGEIVLERGDALKGKPAVILYKEGKAVYVTILPRIGG